MQANQRLVADDGKEVMLFPLPYLYMSQDEGGSFSHGGTKNIDILGWSSSGRVLKAPMYAPCSATCVAIWDTGSNNRVWQSDDVVHTPLGLIRVTFATAHDDSPPPVGTHVVQGQIFAHTGTHGNVTGDHSHFNTASGTYEGYQSHTYQGETNWDLKNSQHVWDICYINDTNIIQGYGHNWQEFQGGRPPTPPPTPEKKRDKFPWVVLTRKIRHKRINV